MVMGQFLTTYRKDYLWPYVKTLGFRPEPDHVYQPQLRKLDDCQCHTLPTVTPTDQQKKTITGPSATQDEQWSRLGPMGPMLEPKAFSARVSAAPESEISKTNQPNVFLVKLQEKYPFIYECLKAAPPDDIIARINRERLSTTYQVDFCDKREYPAAPYDELIRAAGVEGLSPCPEPVRLPGDVCRPSQKMKGRRDSSFTKTASIGASSGDGKLPPPHQITDIFTTPIDYTCPRSPPGPYYKPYTVKKCLLFNKEDQARCNKIFDLRNRCVREKDYVAEMGSWNPYDPDQPRGSDLVEKWGKLNYLADSLHSHGGHFNLRPKRK